jgi:para-nitrobenzyl esterase
MIRVVFTFVALLLVLTGGGAPAFADAVRAHVENGTLVGVAGQGVASYKGIPYAAPPAGDLRWRPPQPSASWRGERDAAEYGYSCPQAAPPGYVRPDSRALTTSEDCLTLNVWTPLAHPHPLPVIVWLHGGGNSSGTGSQMFYDGTSFARDGIVFVTLNYRLGALGFFAHPALSAEANGAPTGNFALLDQIAALRWVHANAAVFGGDPANVTVAGESAGGQDIIALASAPAAHGLFGKAIVESASGIWRRWPTLAQAESQGAKLATELGAPGERATAAQLRALPVTALTRIDDDKLIGPIVDGQVVTQPPLRALAAGLPLPMLIGTNDDEGALFGQVAKPDGLFPIPAADLAAIRARYAAAGASGDAAAARRLLRDAVFAAPARWIAARVAQTGTPVFLYRFDYVLSLLQSRRPGAAHGSEIPFVFESHSTPFIAEGDRQVGSVLHNCWVAFARSGSPAVSGVPWPVYGRTNERRMVFGATPSVQPVDDAAVLDILERDLVGYLNALARDRSALDHE